MTAHDDLDEAVRRNRIIVGVTLVRALIGAFVYALSTFEFALDPH